MERFGTTTLSIKEDSIFVKCVAKKIYCTKLFVSQECQKVAKIDGLGLFWPLYYHLWAVPKPYWLLGLLVRHRSCTPIMNFNREIALVYYKDKSLPPAAYWLANVAFLQLPTYCL